MIGPHCTSLHAEKRKYYITLYFCTDILKELEKDLNLIVQNLEQFWGLDPELNFDCKPSSHL